MFGATRESTGIFGATRESTGKFGMTVAACVSATPAAFARTKVVAEHDTTWNEPLFGALTNPATSAVEFTGRAAGVNVPVYVVCPPTAVATDVIENEGVNAGTARESGD